MTAPIASLAAASPTPVNPSLKLGDIQLGEPRDTSYYAALRTIYEKAVELNHGRLVDPKTKKRFSRADIDTWIAENVAGVGNSATSPIRNFKELSNTITRLDQMGLRPVDPEDLSMAERGALARTVRVGHGMTFGSSDELQGLLAMAHKLFSGREGNQPGAPSYGETYRNARDAQRQYLENAKLSSNGGVLNPEFWGGAATGLALGGGNPTAGLIRSGVTGGALSLAGSLADLPEQNLATYKEHAVPLAVNTAIGAGLGVLPGLAGKRLFALRDPAALRLEKALEASGGEAGLGRAVNAAGTPAPMLAELEGTTFGRLGTELRRASAEATDAALRRVRGELQSAQQAKMAAGQPWDALQTPIASERAGEILARKPLRRIISRMVSEEALVAGQPITGRALEDIRQELVRDAQRLGRAGRGGSAKRLMGWAKELQGIIDNSSEGMAEARVAYGPLAERASRLAEMERRLSRAARSSGVPVENKVTMHSEMLQEMGGEPWQRAQRAAKGMVEPLYTSRTLDEHVRRLLGSSRRFGPLAVHEGGLLPWYMGAGSAGASLGGTVPQMTNPFFQQDTTGH